MKKISLILAILTLGASPTIWAQCTTDAWDVVKGGADPVVANANNPLSGACSLEVPVTFGKRYVEDQMDQETSFRGTFQIDPNSIDIPTSGQERKIKVHNVQCAGGCASGPISEDWLQAKLRKQATGYKLGIWAMDANGVQINQSFDLVDGCNTIEYQLIAGNPGTYRLWVNNSNEAAPDVESTTADFTGRYADRVRMGRQGQGNRINENATGEAFYLDTFESRRQTFIGNTCSP